MNVSQNWSPNQYAEKARFVSDLAGSVFDLLAPVPGETILDLGCGDGALTLKLVDANCKVIAVDASPEMIAAARAKGLDAHVVDGQALPFENAFNAVFSNAALHWMLEPQAVINGVWRALKPGGRFVGEFGGHGNVATIIAAVEAALKRRGLNVTCPWFYPHPDNYRAMLERQGFNVVLITLHPRPTRLPGDVGDWLRLFAQHYLAAVPENKRKALISEIVETLRPHLCDKEGNWTADYIRLRFQADKPLDTE